MLITRHIFWSHVLIIEIVFVILITIEASPLSVMLSAAARLNPGLNHKIIGG